MFKKKDNLPKRFAITDEQSIDLGTLRAMVDTKTGVQYVLYNTGYGSSTFVLLDKDGKPLIDKDYQDDEEVKQ